MREKRNKLIQVKISEEEDKIIAEKAKKIGLDKSVFLRMCGLRFDEKND